MYASWFHEYTTHRSAVVRVAQRLLYSGHARTRRKIPARNGLGNIHSYIMIEELRMKKTLLSLIAAAFVVTSGLAFAAKHDSEKVMAACKDKKPGDTVQVDGKDVKCPKPKKEKK
ncbi:MAG: hypothetical protein A2W18_06595 [Candidatus Muproteobacteria bacterium RBG_16_60_9]|uniref:Uncharacterized protein n=1 Tax=Candidatus Muproteobacteria bacterium RBG_16_60_9 TaxID=1817755 RepID=A0A1F6V5N3_9PROT|nr:MAG: hypothetical protein A2W18_06595 [Candidatus Muproteobacteria bacterium RBG_16_60_9]